MKLSRSCAVCSHSQKREIEELLLAGTPYARVAKLFGLHRRVVSRHLNRHMRAVAEYALQARVVESGRSVLERLRDLNREAMDLLAEARQDGERKDALAAIHTLHRLLELEARLLGELAHERPQVQVNVLATPEWLALRAQLVEALRPYPEAAHAAAKVLANGSSN